MLKRLIHNRHGAVDWATIQDKDGHTWWFEDVSQ
jgi:hypothetical protein